MNLEIVGKVIKDVGFPIFVAVYLLVQMVSIAPKVEAIQRALDQIAASQLRIVFLLERGERR